MNRYFDLHCDTPTTLYRTRTPWKNAVTHVSPQSMSVFDQAVQCFAIFLDDTRPKQDFSYLCRVYNFFFSTLNQPNLTALFTVEGGGAAMDPELQNLDRLANMGLRMFGLVWNGENPLATGAVQNQSTGLTSLGKTCVRKLEQLRILPDVSHLSDRGFRDLAAQTHGPIVASHSNARALWNHPRNLTDDQAREIILRKGLIGLNFYPRFLGDTPGIEDILRHADHFLDLGAENCLALGGDWDGIDTLPREITGPESIPILKEKMRDRYGDTLTEKILYQNAAMRFNPGGYLWHCT